MSKYRYTFTINLGVHGEIHETIDLVEEWGLEETRLMYLTAEQLESELKHIWQQLVEIKVGGSIRERPGGMPLEIILMGCDRWSVCKSLPED